MTSDDDKSFEKLFRDYFLETDGEMNGFNGLILSGLPAELRNNRACDIYLVHSSKQFFGDWLYAAVIEMVNSSRPKAAGETVDVTCNIFIEAMQKMVGEGLRAAKNQFAPKEEGDLLEALTFSHDGISEMPAGYEKYNPEGLQFCNMGGLHLIPSPFMPWSVELFRFIVDSYKKENIMENRGEYIATSLSKLRKNDTIVAAFKQIIRDENIITDEAIAEKIHLRIAEFAFRAYTKQKNNREFNKIKTLASDMTNVSFCTSVQTGEHSAKEEHCPKSVSITKSNLLKELGVNRNPGNVVLAGTRAKQKKLACKVRGQTQPTIHAEKRTVRVKNFVRRAKYFSYLVRTMLRGRTLASSKIASIRFKSSFGN